MTLPLPILPRWFRYVGVLAVVSVITYFSLAGTVSSPSGAGNLWDKQLHFLAYGTLTLALAYATIEYRHHPYRVLTVILGAVLFGTLIEVWQGLLTNRYMSFLDWVANVIGVGLASLWFLLEPRLQFTSYRDAFTRN